MKKYLIIGLLVLGFLVPAYSFAQSTETLPSDIDPAGDVSSCVSLVNNLRYRSRDVNTNGEVSTLQDYLQSKSYLNSEPTGYFGLLTLKAVKAFQKDNKINPTGYVGPVTRAKIKDLSCGGTTSNSVVTISGISGPESLNVNKQGTWTIKASSSTGGALSYGVVWGDEAVLTTQGVNEPNRPAPQQSATFTHAYSKAGIYKVIFTVTSANTINCITTPCSDDSGSAQVSLTVKVAGAVTPANYMTVLSPNGGEKWAKGTTQTIKWQDNTPILTSCPTGTGCVRPMPQYYDIKLVSYGPTCTSVACTNLMRPIRDTRNIATNVAGLSYEWKIAPEYEVQERGNYYIEVCKAGTNNCDSSDKDFSILALSTTNSAKLYITPETASLRIGGNTTFQAMYQPAEPACVSAVPSCKIATPAPYAVEATWTSNDTKVATVAYKDTCPPGAYCLMQQLDKKFAVVTGVSAGDALITANYKDPNGSSTAPSMIASVKVTVTSKPIAICDYAAPPAGCIYVNGGNYDPATQCGLVLKCDSSDTKERVLGAESFKFISLLKLGSKGNEVTELQKYLNNKGYNVGTPDGNFGQKTKEAIIKLQVSNGLTADGVVGALVRAILNK